MAWVELGVVVVLGWGGFGLGGVGLGGGGVGLGVVVVGGVGLGWAAVVLGCGSAGWVGRGGGGGVFTNLFLFCFVDTVLFCRTVFVGRWVAMVLTSSSCNLGIDNFDSRQVPKFIKYYLILIVSGFNNISGYVNI